MVKPGSGKFLLNTLMKYGLLQRQGGQSQTGGPLGRTACLSALWHVNVQREPKREAI